MPICDNCEETVSSLVDYFGDKVCERCAADWEEQDQSDAAYEYRHVDRFSSESKEGSE